MYIQLPGVEWEPIGKQIQSYLINIMSPLILQLVIIIVY